MPDADLTPRERVVLLILMAEAREVPNTALTKEHQAELKKASREKLVKDGFIKVTPGSPMLLELTDKGGRRALEEFGAEAPAGSGAASAALYKMIALIKRFAERLDLPISELFVRDGDRLSPADIGVEFSPAEIEAQIGKAYNALARHAGDWIKLADLRDSLRSIPTKDLDAALVRLNRTPSVNIIPASDQRVLTDRERAAAVIIGNQDRHEIAIGLS